MQLFSIFIIINIYHRKLRKRVVSIFQKRLIIKNNFSIFFTLQFIYLDGEKINVPDVKIKEWVWSKTNPYLRPEVVRAEPIGWAVPTIQRLWFGSTIDDKRRRLRAFLTCMRSDTPLMLNPGYVPQHLLVMASVLRYVEF